jgi:hypothetical protein
MYTGDSVSQAEHRAAQQKKSAAPALGAAEIAELTKTYDARVKEFNAQITQRLNELNKNFTANRKQTQTDLNAELARMRTEHAQAVKNEDAELRGIKDRAERTARQKDINAERLARTNAINSFQQKEIPARLKALDNEVIQARKDINTEKTTVLKDLATAFNDTKAYIPVALGRGDSPSLELMTAAQRQEIQKKQAAEAQAAATARAQAEAQARAQADAAKQAQMQEFANQAMQQAQQRKGQNYAQMYNLLTQNMPVPVGYGQPASSQQARTTTIGAGGDDQMGRQMSPAQIAQMATMRRGSPGIMPQGTPLPPEMMQQMAQQQASRQAAQQQVAQETPQAPQPAKRGGIMRGM